MLPFLKRPLGTFSLFLTTFLFLYLFVPSVSYVAGYILLYSFIVSSVLVFHECGHLVFGKMAGLQFVMLRVGPFEVYSEGTKWKVRENTEWIYVGGVAQMLPKDSSDPQLHQKWAWYIIGGPITSLVFSITGLFLLKIAPDELFASLFIFGLAHGLIGMVTLIPNNSGGLKSDGLNFQILKKGGKPATLTILTILLNKEMLSERRPSQWDGQVVSNSIKEFPLEDIENTRSLASLLAYYYLDKGDFEACACLLEPYVEAPAPKLTRNQDLIDNLYVTSIALAGSQPFQEKMSAISERVTSKDPFLFLKTKAAISLVNKNKEEAQGLLMKAEKAFPMILKKYGVGQLEWDIMQQLKRKWDQTVESR